MQAFNDLRQAARDRRDKLIAKARQEYEDILAKLAVVERDLLGREPGSLRSIQASVERVIPADRPFTGADILLALEAIDPRRPWRRRSVDHSIARLRQKGLVRRLSKPRNGGQRGSSPATYVRAESPVKPSPFAAMQLTGPCTSTTVPARPR
jgi:hypothetical protein